MGNVTLLGCLQYNENPGCDSTPVYQYHSEDVGLSENGIPSESSAKNFYHFMF